MSSDREIVTPEGMARALREVGYIADTGLATLAYLAYVRQRPLFLEGDPGVGKTELAKKLALVTGGKELLRLQCYEGIDRRQALYDWDFARQLIHLRSVGDDVDSKLATKTVYGPEFLIPRPLLLAVQQGAPLLIDEIDRADDEFEAFLLELLSDFTVTIPDLQGDNTFVADPKPIVVITSNRTREVHDALKRRCYYHWVAHPNLTREIEIVRLREPGASEELVAGAARVAARLRAAKSQLLKPPGVSETIDLVGALHELGHERFTAEAAASVIGVFLKCSEDIDQVTRDGGLNLE